MAKLRFEEGKVLKTDAKFKKTAQDIRRPKRSSLNKSKKRNFKAYKGQGKLH